MIEERPEEKEPVFEEYTPDGVPVPAEVMEARRKYTKENPHPTGAWWDEEDRRWHDYKSVKGISPPWLPYHASRRRYSRKTTINERKFLMILSQTGNLFEAFRAVYKFGYHPDKRIERARVYSQAKKVLERIKKKEPELVAAFTFNDVNPDYLKKEMMKLYHHDHATIGEKTRLLELMGKTQAMFTDKIVSDTKIREIIEPVYQESSDDFPDKVDERRGRIEIEEEKINFA